MLAETTNTIHFELKKGKTSISKTKSGDFQKNSANLKKSFEKSGKDEKIEKIGKNEKIEKMGKYEMEKN